MHTVDDGDSINVMNLGYLTDRLRDIGAQVLPKNRYGIMTQQSIVDRLGSQERAEKECREATCIADLGRKINADYIAQGRIGRFSGKLTLKVELYKVSNSNLLASLTGDSKNLEGLLALMNEKAPDLFKKMPGVSDGRITPFVAGGIIGLEKSADYVLDYEKRYLANFATEPAGAVLSFNGMPAANCPKTPCSIELAEGSVRIIAALDQYETADTVVLIKQNGQNINIRFKSNFGFLEVKPAYLEGVGRGENWNFTINGKLASSWESKLSPGKYNVKLSHRCYEDIGFEVGINRDKREVFDMGSHVKLKLGGLVLSAEKDGKPVSEPVFVDGKRAGETPFSGSLPLCSEIKVGEDKEKVNVKLEHKQTVRYLHKVQPDGVLIDSRDGKRYKVVEIGNQKWMAENLNYDAGGGKCYDNNPVNCKKYGRLYNWSAAKNICPSGWRLPGKSEYKLLDDAVGGEEVAGEKLKAKSGWSNSGNGTDDYGFSALPGGSGYSGGSSFSSVGDAGFWWSTGESHLWNANENSSDYAQARHINYEYEDIEWGSYGKSNLFSVRCINAPLETPVASEIEDEESGSDEEWDYSSKKEDKRKVFSFSWGLRFGFNTSYLYAEYDNAYTNASGTYKSTSGVGVLVFDQFGLIFDWALRDWFHLQPSIMFIAKGTGTEKKENDNYYGYSHGMDLPYIEIPLLFSLKFSALRINAGPYFGIGIDGIGYDDFLLSSDFGLSAGLGFDIGKFSIFSFDMGFYIGMFYDYGLTKSFSYSYNDSHLKAYNRTLGFNLGVNFL